MAFTQEVEDWLKELQLTPEERAVLDPVLGKPERLEKVKGSVLRQSEFTRKMQALDKQKQDAEAALAERERLVAEDAASLGTWKQTADKTILENQRALEAAKTRAYQLEQRMTSLAEQQGVDPKEWGLDGEQKPPETKTSPDFSEFDKRFVPRGEAEKIMQELKSSPFIAAELEDIVDEHRSMFGKGLNRKELVMSALKNKRSLREEWETVNEVAKKRDEMKEKQYDDKYRQKYEEERTKLLSEQRLPVNRGPDSGSPLLAMREDLRLSGKDRSASGSTDAVTAAISAHNTGKYRTSTPVSEKGKE